MRVLVVDDDAPIREAIDEVLSDEGFEVESLADATDAVVSARAFRPDVALIDYNMPALDGLTLARRLHEDPALRKVPVILMSAHPPAADLTRGLAVLPKPFSIRRLVEMLRGAHGESQVFLP